MTDFNELLEFERLQNAMLCERLCKLEAERGRFSAKLQVHIDWWRTTGQDTHGISNAVLGALESIKSAWEGKP